MINYEELARELMEVFDRRGPVPPQDKVSKSIRGEMAVLRLLDHEKRMMTAGDISRISGMKTPRIAAVLNSLEKKKLIERCTDEKDKRRVMVNLTPRGEEFCLKCKEEATAHMAKILFYLGEEDAREYVRLMKRMNEILPLVGPPEHEEMNEERNEKRNQKEESDE